LAFSIRGGRSPVPRGSGFGCVAETTPLRRMAGGQGAAPERRRPGRWRCSVERGALPCRVNRRGDGSGWWYSVARRAKRQGRGLTTGRPRSDGAAGSVHKSKCPAPCSGPAAPTPHPRPAFGPVPVPGVCSPGPGRLGHGRGATVHFSLTITRKEVYWMQGGINFHPAAQTMAARVRQTTPPSTDLYYAPIFDDFRLECGD
jgi:hypothetical protein